METKINLSKEWLEGQIGTEPEECGAGSSYPLNSEPAFTNAEVLAPELTHENLSSLTLVDLKDLWNRLFAAMKADGCTGFHATPDIEALEKLPSDEERERHWLIGVMGMLGASLRGEYEDVTETLR